MTTYINKLDALCAWAEAHPGCGGTRAIRKIVMDLEGEGPIGELLHTLDAKLFSQVLDLFVEFRRSGRNQSFNSIHRAARQRLNPQDRSINR